MSQFLYHKSRLFLSRVETFHISYHTKISLIDIKKYVFPQLLRIG